MAKRILKSGNPYYFQRPGTFDTGLAALLPKEYQKFYREWKTQPTPVHYQPRPGKYEVKHGKVLPIQNVPLPVRYPKEFHQGLWGGEGILKGFRKKVDKRRFPHFWMPTLKKTVVYSAVLNKHMEVVGTDRLIQLIYHHKGFDEYLLETKANDLQSLLALKLKREILKAIHAGAPAWADNPEKQQEVLSKYKKFGDEYTPTEVDWYGYDLLQATTRIQKIKEAEELAKIKPLKHEFRRKLIEDLKSSGLDVVERVSADSSGKIVEDLTENRSWLSKLNPFAKK